MSDYRLLVRDLWSYHRWRLVALIALMTLVGLVEGLAVALLLPLLARLGIASAPTTGAFASVLLALDGVIGDGWFYLAVLISAAAVLQAVLVLAQGWLTAQMSQSYVSHWKMRLMRAFLYAEWPFLVERKAGELISAITNETGRLSAAALNLFNLVAALIVGLIYLGYGLALSPIVTAAVLALAAVLVLALGRLYRFSFHLGQQAGPLLSEQQVLVGEFLQGAKAVKAAVMEERATLRIGTVVKNLERANRLSAFLPFVVRAVFESGGLIALVVLLLVAVKQMDIPFANLLVVLALFVRLFPRLSSLQQYVHSLNAYLPSISTLTMLADEAEARVERLPEQTPSAVRIPVPGKIALSHVDVTLGGKKILSDVTADIMLPGITAIVGKSGAGKSTLLAALLRLAPTQGAITLNGTPISKLPLAGWRRAVGFVPQEPILFHASIRDNLSIIWPEAGPDDIAEAAGRAQLDEFVRMLPDGYETIVGDQGVRLSGGQRQRLGLARALLGRPHLLVLDEATSALDSITEAGILATLEELSHNIGVVLVAHRLASVRRADRIIVLNEGRVVESGDWSSLMGRSGQFRSLAVAQQL